jgi:hypothetical protein
MNTIKDLINSKKFIVLVLAVGTVILCNYFKVDLEAIIAIASSVGTYLFAQGLSDYGKEAVKSNKK